MQLINAWVSTFLYCGEISLKRDLIQTKSNAPKLFVLDNAQNKKSFLKNKNHKMKLSAILIGAAVASDYDYDALGNKKCKFEVRDSAYNLSQACNFVIAERDVNQ